MSGARPPATAVPILTWKTTAVAVALAAGVGPAMAAAFDPEGAAAAVTEGMRTAPTFMIFAVALAGIVYFFLRMFLGALQRLADQQAKQQTAAWERVNAMGEACHAAQDRATSATAQSATAMATMATETREMHTKLGRALDRLR